MYSCTINLSLLTFDMIIYTKSQLAIILHSIIFYYVNRFRKSMNLFLLIGIYNTLKDAKKNNIQSDHNINTI